MHVKVLQYEGQTFGLREVIDVDHEWLVELHNDPVVLNNITNPNPITLEEHLAWWKSLNPNREKRLIFTVDYERAGFAKFYQIDHTNHNCLLGGDIHKESRGHGFARHMWTLMLQFCFDELKLWRVALTTAEYNNIGQKVYRRLGFIDEGRHVQSLYRDGKYHDELLMYMTKEIYDGQKDTDNWWNRSVGQNTDSVVQ